MAADKPFKLEIPLDASAVEDFKPHKGVKVALASGGRVIASRPVEMNAKGVALVAVALRGGHSAPAACGAWPAATRCLYRRSGQSYRFVAPGARVAVDVRDRPSLLSFSNLRQV